MGYGNRPLTKANVLRTISEFDIFKYYCIPFKRLGEAFCSELRKDAKPTCYIFQYKSRLLYKDFGSGDALDCFAYVQKKYNLSFMECLRVIANDFNLKLGSFSLNTPTLLVPGIVHKGNSATQSKKQPTVIKVYRRGWNTEDKKYWLDQYGLSVTDLIHVYPLKGFSINDSYIQAEPVCYGYYFGLSDNAIHQWKVYQPYASKGKWFSNCTNGNLQGYDLIEWLGDRLIITKSYKDVLVLKKAGYQAIAPHGEGHNIDSQIINVLKHRFSKIDIIYDNDAAGIKTSKSLSNKYNLNNITLPEFGGKDISDYVKEFGYTALKQLLDSYYPTMGE